MDNQDLIIEHSQKMADTLKSLWDLTVRLDERVKALGTDNTDLDRKLDSVSKQVSDINQRISSIEGQDLKDDVEQLAHTVHSMELDVEKIKGETSRSGERWKHVVQFGLQLVSAILIAYLLYKLHIK